MGRPRSTHDIDIFVRPEDAEASLEALARHGFETERTDARWLFKGWKEDMMVDVIFKSSGDIYFDNEMHERAKMIPYHGRQIPAVAPEDLVIIKAAVHNEIGPHHWHDALAILSHATMDWAYLIKRARRAPRRILALLVYAQSNDILIPNHVITDLFQVIFGQAPAKGHGVSSVSRVGENVVKQAQGPSTPMREGMPVYLVGHIQDSLANDPRTAALDVQLKLGNNRILVKGECQSDDARRAIEEIVRHRAPTGYDVDNQVRVTEMRAPEAEEVL